MTDHKPVGQRYPVRHPGLAGAVAPLNAASPRTVRRAIEGIDVVNKIFALPVSPTRSEGSMKGQMLEPAAITKVERNP